jgi:hypothetical protein
VRRKILDQARGEFVCSALNVAIEGGYYGGDIFPFDGLVVVIDVSPDGVASFRVAEFEIE